MIVNVKGTLLDVLQKSYEYNGKSGISYQLVVYCEGVLQKIKVTENVYNDYKDMINHEIELECNVFVNGSYSLTFRG